MHYLITAKNFIIFISEISKIKRISFRHDINGLRAIAVLVVVFYHAEILFFKGGWLGVDIFFVISGYLISNIIISELNENNFSISNFYLRRVNRIFPVFYFTLLISIPFSYFLLTQKAYDEYLASLISSIFFFSNYHFMNLDFYIAESTKLMPLLHTWSLAIEEQFYIIFPLFAVLIYKYFKKYFFLIVTIVTFSSLYVNTTIQSTEKFYRLEFRIWELLLGAIVMILSSNFNIKNLEKLGLPLIFLPIIYFNDDWINDLEPKLFALSGVVLVIFSNANYSFLTKISNFKWISKIGLSSYSIYLLHQPLFAFYKLAKKNLDLIIIKNFNFELNSLIEISEFQLSKNNILFNSNSYLVTGVLILMTITLGNYSYKFIEKPFLNNSNFKIILLIFTFLLIFSILKPVPNLENITNIESPTDETVFSDFMCWNEINIFKDNFETFDSCKVNNFVNKNLIILGDSSAAAIAKSISKNDLFKNYNINFVSIVYENFFQDFKEYNSCQKCFLSWIETNRPTVVLSIEFHRYLESDGIYYSKYSSSDSEVLKGNIEYLYLNSEDLYIIEPFPTVPQNKLSPLELIKLDRNNKIREIYIEYSTWKNNTPKVENFLNEIINDYDVNLVSTDELFCNINSNRCHFYINSDLLYLDHVHLSKIGAKLITDELVSAFRND